MQAGIEIGQFNYFEKTEGREKGISQKIGQSPTSASIVQELNSYLQVYFSYLLASAKPIINRKIIMKMIPASKRKGGS
jgi:hypothetical protein